MEDALFRCWSFLPLCSSRTSRPLPSRQNVGHPSRTQTQHAVPSVPALLRSCCRKALVHQDKQISWCLVPFVSPNSALFENRLFKTHHQDPQHSAMHFLVLTSWAACSDLLIRQLLCLSADIVTEATPHMRHGSTMSVLIRFAVCKAPPAYHGGTLHFGMSNTW